MEQTSIFHQNKYQWTYNKLYLCEQIADRRKDMDDIILRNKPCYRNKLDQNNIHICAFKYPLF